MTDVTFRRYPRNSPQAAGRILATALLAGGDADAPEWRRLDAAALAEIGLAEAEWQRLIDGLCRDLLLAAQAGEDCHIDAGTLAGWLAEIDDPCLQRRVLDLCARIVEADGVLHPGELVLMRAALRHWVLPVDAEQRVGPLVYGLDFQVVARPGMQAPA